ncbi:MAG: 1,4-alpha-glucan branching enzyme, partial [Actinomycetota bacterium]|nr:1,4-alpha-glucan branching enzyme [Actinomycetota bacterium]
MTVATRDLEALARREHGDPHSILGAHPDSGGVTIRALRPAAQGISVVLPDGAVQGLEQIHPAGIFEGVIADAELPLTYRLQVDYGESG